MLRDLGASANAWPVVVAGSGPERERLERQAADLDFEVAFPGWVEHSSLLRLIRDAHAFLLPGAWNEPLSRLLLEAMALGTPVVTWKSGGNPEHIESGKNAWVVDGAEELGGALRELDDEQRRGAVGDAGRALAGQRFSPDAVYPQLLAVYGAAIDVAGSGEGSP